MPRKPLAELSPNEGRELLRAAQAPEAPTNQLFYDGDHWQGGAGWIGPKPGPSEPGAAQVIAQILSGFTSRNVIAEVVQRHANGLVGREPKWSLGVRRDLAEDEEPNDAEQALIDEAEALLTEWWNDRGMHELFQQLVCTALHQRRGLLRIYVPEGRLRRFARTVQNTDGSTAEVSELRAQAPDIERALGMVYVDSPHPNNAVVADDPLTAEPVGVHLLKLDDVDYVDLYFVQRNEDLTLGATVHRRTGGAASSDMTYELGGRLLVGQLERPLLVTTQVQQQQRAVNLAESMIPRNLVMAGFLERVIRGAQMPGTWVDDETAVGGKRWVPGEYNTGPGTVNWLQPVVVKDAEGKPHLSNPDITYREPTSPKHAIEGGLAHYTSILHEVDQLHHQISGDATASGVSRVEARVDFLHSLRRTQTPTERLGRWVLEAVLALAEAIAGTPGKYTRDLRADFACRLFLGQLTAEEQLALVSMVESGLLPREDAMALLGVDDVDMAIAKINSQPGALLKMRQAQAEALRAWLDAGVILEVAVKLLGLSDEDQEMLLKQAPQGDPDDPGQPPQPTPAPSGDPGDGNTGGS
jgi:hypothetical protein